VAGDPSGAPKLSGASTVFRSPRATGKTYVSRARVKVAAPGYRRSDAICITNVYITAPLVYKQYREHVHVKRPYQPEGREILRELAVWKSGPWQRSSKRRSKDTAAEVSEEANASYAALRANRTKWKEEIAERELWTGPMPTDWKIDECHPTLRGEVWLLDLDPTKGANRPAAAGTGDFRRPVQSWAGGTRVVLPVTSRHKGFHFTLADTAGGGVTRESFIKCEDVRSVSIERFARLWAAFHRGRWWPLRTAFGSDGAVVRIEPGARLHLPQARSRNSWPSRPLAARASAGGRELSRSEGSHRALRLHTVCEARLPNVGECWNHRTATFMILGTYARGAADSARSRRARRCRGLR